MELKILCVMTVLNIVMLVFNAWMRIDSEKTLAELKKRIYTKGAGTGKESFHRACGNGSHSLDKGGKLWADEE
jgi:hypothetical protein